MRGKLARPDSGTWKGEDQPPGSIKKVQWPILRSVRQLSCAWKRPAHRALSARSPWRSATQAASSAPSTRTKLHERTSSATFRSRCRRRPSVTASARQSKNCRIFAFLTFRIRRFSPIWVVRFESKVRCQFERAPIFHWCTHQAWRGSRWRLPRIRPKRISSRSSATALRWSPTARRSWAWATSVRTGPLR